MISRIMNNKNFLALDLEMNQPSGKIIQVGIAIGNSKDGILLTHSWLLDPQEEISPRIEELTGISNEMIGGAASHETMTDELSTYIEEHNTFVNPVQWGVGDRDILMKEIKERQIHFPFFGRREIDVKQIYVYLSMAQSRNTKGGLKSAMGRYKMPFEGKAHSADVDAENTLRFFFHLLNRQSTIETSLVNLSKT